MTTLRDIRSAIVDRLRRNEPTAHLEAALAAEHAAEAARQEFPKLKAIADQRQEWQRQADALKVRVSVQEAAVEAYLKAVSAVVLPLKEVAEKGKSLVELERVVFGNGEGFHDQDQFTSIVNSIPTGYLPENFSCPYLVEDGGLVPAENQGIRAVALLRQAYALLAGLKKQRITFPQRQLRVDL